MEICFSLDFELSFELKFEILKYNFDFVLDLIYYFFYIMKQKGSGKEL